jgi:hypothetical protein
LSGGDVVGIDEHNVLVLFDDLLESVPVVLFLDALFGLLLDSHDYEFIIKE